MGKWEDHLPSYIVVIDSDSWKAQTERLAEETEVLDTVLEILVSCFLRLVNRNYDKPFNIILQLVWLNIYNTTLKLLL